MLRPAVQSVQTPSGSRGAYKAAGTLALEIRSVKFTWVLAMVGANGDGKDRRENECGCLYGKYENKDRL